MSSASRSTPRGGKGAKQEATKALRNDTKVDSTKTPDHNPKVQPTAEQMRIAQIIDTRTDDPGFKDKIRQVMEATRKTEDEVCTALHDCDNDLDRAVNMLLEGMGQGEWETSVKKKKSRQPAPGGTKSDIAALNTEEEWGDSEPAVVNVVERERSRTRGGGPPRMRGRGSLDNRGWRGRENKENERNLDDGRGEGFRRGGGRMTSGPGRSGRGGRGGGRLGPRTFQSREKPEDSSFPRSIDTWNNPGAEESGASEPLKMEDWDNEEYTGSLADTKVFTPSGGTAESAADAEPIHEASVADLSTSLGAQNLSSSLTSSTSQMSQGLDLQQSSQMSQSPVPMGVGTLNAAQSEYLSQLTQGSESLKSSASAAASAGAAYPATSSSVFQSAAQTTPSAYTATPAAAAAAAYATTGYANSYDVDTAGHNSAQMPPRAKTQQRPRVPPPSKIPSSAVEMPGDAINSGMSYLDVQFGGLEFGSETGTFEPPGLEQSSKYTSASVLESMTSAGATSRNSTSNLDLAAAAAAAQSQVMDSYAAAQKAGQNSMAQQMSQSLSSSGVDSILSSSEHVKSRGNEQSYQQSRSSQLQDLDKNDVLSYSVASGQAAYQTYQNQKSGAGNYQQTPSYSSSSYASNNAVTSSTTSYPANQSQMSYASTGSSYSTPAAAAPSSYQNSAYSQSSTNSGSYQTGQASYPSISQASAFSATGPSYQGNSQSVYGSSSGLGSSGYASSNSGQYQNNYGTAATTAQQNHTKLSSSLSTTTKESQYDTTTTSTSNLSNSNGGVSSGGVSSLSSTTPAATSAASTKVSSATATGKSGVVPNIPPGVPPMLGTHQYIMSQTGLPFYQQATPMYSYEDLQLMQQRIPHMPTGYYDMTFQAPTSLATGREGLASVAYSMSDGRFPRNDNASPVPATLSQQQQQQNASQAHTQPMLNASGLPPGYTYYIQGGMVPGGFQYGTPALYPQMPAASNAHGSASTTQYAKPGGYGAGYGSGYDSLTQTQDYGKTGGYVSNSQSQSKPGVGTNAGTTGSASTDITANMMYGKSHVALSKVNSYEKQGFHSGTPPPFNLAGSASTAMASSGAYAPQLFIPTMPPHQQQHHSTTLMHQPPHQMEMRNPNRRSESGGSSNQRQSATQANKSASKQGYNPSYWTPN